MAILRVEDFTATADVLGLVKRVKYSAAEGRLCIEATSADEAVSILGQLAIGQVQGLTAKSTPDGEAALVSTAFTQDPEPAPEPQAAPAPEPAPVQQAAPEPAPAPEPEPTPAPEPEPAPAKKAAPKKAAPAKRRQRKAKPKPVPQAKVQQDIAAMTYAEPEPVAGPEPQPPLPEPAQAAEATQPAPEPEPTPAPEPAAGGNGAAVPQELLGAKKIRDVVNHFYEQGHTKPDDIVARCLAVKEDVKVLARIRNVEERVRRAITVMGLA